MKAPQPSVHPGRVDFSQSPFLVIWETTRSCGLACQHCRASAILKRDPGELTTAEGRDVLTQVAAMGTPICILSGGDPLNRIDLEELVRHGKREGLRMGTIPAATPNLTRARIQGLKDAGLDQLAFSLDAPTALLHDQFRGVPGSFAKTMEGIGFAHDVGLPLQINTCFAAWNIDSLEEMIQLVSRLGIVFWEVFFLVPMGRGQAMKGVTSEQFEMAFDRLYRLNDEASFIVKITEAPHYRRFVVQREKSLGKSSEAASAHIQHVLARPRGVQGSMGMSPQAVNAGKGFMFIDHLGAICPSGFLPIQAGHVRTHRLAEVYRNTLLFQDLRNPALLKGRCGVCEFGSMCGGSRARAYAMTGDYLAEEPFCAYVPKSSSLVMKREEGAPC